MMDQMVSEIEETLLDWFETIEEVDLGDVDKAMLRQVAESMAAAKHAAMDMGVQPEDFDEWLRFDILENWSQLMEENVTETQLVQAFVTFVQEGEDRLYFQMLKRCLPVAAQMA